MARKKRQKWPYKFVTVDNHKEYEGLSIADLTKKVLQFDTNEKAETKNKKNSQSLKELRGTVNSHRKQYEESSETFDKAKEEFEHEKAKRDADIFDELEEKKALESGFNTSINSFKEHKNVCLKILKDKQARRMK